MYQGQFSLSAWNEGMGLADVTSRREQPCCRCVCIQSTFLVSNSIHSRLQSYCKGRQKKTCLLSSLCDGLQHVSYSPIQVKTNITLRSWARLRRFSRPSKVLLVVA